MFTGIVETMARIRHLRREGTNIHIDLTCPIQSELKVDQSVSHNGVCLTVVNVNAGFYRVTAVQETLDKTNLGDWKVGDRVNIERCMPANGRFDGHIVQGHVDQVGTVTRILDKGGSWEFDFAYDPSKGNVTVEKGSICINGTSLTCFNSREGAFSVAIIPYTFNHTVFHQMAVGDRVNLEFDVVGKYIQRILKGYGA